MVKEVRLKNFKLPSSICNTVFHECYCEQEVLVELGFLLDFGRNLNRFLVFFDWI